jgi:hypothetical protein
VLVLVLEKLGWGGGVFEHCACCELPTRSGLKVERTLERKICRPYRRVANKPRVERTKRLEGSRFAAWQLYRLAAGGSRERLEVWQFCGPVVSAARYRRDGQNIALGHSREPPAANR